MILCRSPALFIKFATAKIWFLIQIGKELILYYNICAIIGSNCVKFLIFAA